MGLGLGIVMLAGGLILALGVRDNFTDVDLSVIGWILAGVGALSIILTLVMQQQRNRTKHEVVEDRRDITDRRGDDDRR